MKAVRRILLLVLLLVVIVPVMLLVLLTSPYATQTWNTITQRLNLPVQAEQVTYEFPYHLQLQGVTTPAVGYIERADLWLNPDLRRDGRWIVDSLLLDGINLPDGLAPVTLSKQVYFHQIALKNIDYADDAYALRGLNLQIQQPQWLADQQTVPFGAIQVSAEQLYWQGEAFNQLLLDLNYQPKDSTVYGASFEWRGSQISGQAEQYGQHWSLVNVTLDKLRLNQAQITSLAGKPWPDLLSSINHINSLDLLNAEIQYGPWHWQNLDLSLEDAEWPLTLWQSRATLSLQADSVRFDSQVAIEPRLQARLLPDHIQLPELSLEWQQGALQLSGQLEPHRWTFNRARLSGLKWTIEAPELGTWWHALGEQVQEIHIDQLEVTHSQIIQLASTPYWQLSGLNLDGQSLSLTSHHQRWGMWQGKLEASVINASYAKTLTSHAALAMTSNDGFWQLTRLFVPLEQGYLEGSAQIDLNTTGQPWSLRLDGDGLPVSLLGPYLPAALQFTGHSDLSLQLQGLAGDQSMLAYSLSGTLEANFRDTSLRSTDQATFQPVNLSPLRLQANRGEIAIQPMTIRGKALRGSITGQFDLANDPRSGIQYQLDYSCGRLAGDLLSGEVQTPRCMDKKTELETSPARYQNLDLEVIEEEWPEPVYLEEEETIGDTPVTEKLITAE
ncbi:AsmA family protein [Vibrio sp. CAU 1672]|uniref:AsmA family protein n=1 Tax=Vibrio sp. CAU 1672 TaxID=3032594 RepID=UPI0023DAA6A8|nr:AsmA family protein [Vibrio sp. CAU 1672]MDF2154001.1 AsmA family protein [Vibrio sp. CAU 1672]